MKGDMRLCRMRTPLGIAESGLLLCVTCGWKMKIDGYDALDSACKKRWCWSPGNYQHRGACGSGGSRNTGMTTRCCLERAYRGCPDPVPEPGAPAPWDEVTPN